MFNPRVFVVACAGVIAACATGQSAETEVSRADIANVASVKSTFGPQFQVSEVAPTGIDPRLLAPLMLLVATLALILLRRRR